MKHASQEAVPAEAGTRSSSVLYPDCRWAGWSCFGVGQGAGVATRRECAWRRRRGRGPGNFARCPGTRGFAGALSIPLAPPPASCGSPRVEKGSAAGVPQFSPPGDPSFRPARPFPTALLLSTPSLSRLPAGRDPPSPAPQRARAGERRGQAGWSPPPPPRRGGPRRGHPGAEANRPLPQRVPSAACQPLSAGLDPRRRRGWGGAAASAPPSWLLPGASRPLPSLWPWAPPFSLTPATAAPWGGSSRFPGGSGLLATLGRTSRGQRWWVAAQTRPGGGPQGQGPS